MEERMTHICPRRQIKKRKNSSTLTQWLLLPPSLHTGSQDVYILFPSQCVHFKKREVMNAPCEWGCHGEVVPGKE